MFRKLKSRTVVRLLRFLPFARKRYQRTAILANCKILLDFSKPHQRVRRHFAKSNAFFDTLRHSENCAFCLCFLFVSVYDCFSFRSV